jgi:hypothetical protein
MSPEARKSLAFGLSRLALTFLTFSAVSPAVADPKVTQTCAEGIERIEDCPDSGCGEFGDALLDHAKNEMPSAISGAHKTLDDIRSMVQPTRWNTGSNRKSIQGLGKEGTVVEVRAYVLRVKPGGAESSNCGLTRRVDTDVHIALVDELEDDERTSVTAEVTPRVRRNGHPNWIYIKLKDDLEGEYVKVVGLLLLDTKHIRQVHRVPGEPRWNKGLTRATNWEIHPISGLWKCTKSKHACDNGNGWEEVAP